MFTRITVSTAALLLSSFASMAQASENSLYAEAAPDDASFVRFIGFKDEPSMTFAGKAFDLSENEGHAYVPVSSALLKDVEVGSFVSLIKQPDGAVETIYEGPRKARSKVFLFLVNGSDTALELRLADGSATVLADVAPNSAEQRGVNPVSVSLGVFPANETTPMAVFDVALKRGQNISFIADKRGVQLVENRFSQVAK